MTGTKGAVWCHRHQEFHRSACSEMHREGAEAAVRAARPTDKPTPYYPKLGEPVWYRSRPGAEHIACKCIGEIREVCGTPVVRLQIEDREAYRSATGRDRETISSASCFAISPRDDSTTPDLSTVLREVREHLSDGLPISDNEYEQRSYELLRTLLNAVVRLQRPSSLQATVDTQQEQEIVRLRELFAWYLDQAECDVERSGVGWAVFWLPGDDRTTLHGFSDHVKAIAAAYAAIAREEEGSS